MRGQHIQLQHEEQAEGEDYLQGSETGDSDKDLWLVPQSPGNYHQGQRWFRLMRLTELDQHISNIRHTPPPDNHHEHEYCLHPKYKYDT